MAAYMLLCNFTDQGVRNIKEAQPPSGGEGAWQKMWR